MVLFHSRTVRSVGGLKRRKARRVVGETFEEMLRVSGENPESCTINRPPRDVESYKSRSLPMLWVDDHRRDLFEKYESEEVSDDHIHVLTWMLRKKMYFDHFRWSKDVETFFTRGIRGAVVELLSRGSWVDDPETPGLTNFNKQVEKIDLGRRSDLNFNSRQNLDIMKYDLDAKRTDLPDPFQRDQEYAQADFMNRRAMREQKPWMAAAWLAQYGE